MPISSFPSAASMTITPSCSDMTLAMISKENDSVPASYMRRMVSHICVLRLGIRASPIRLTPNSSLALAKEKNEPICSL